MSGFMHDPLTARYQYDHRRYIRLLRIKPGLHGPIRCELRHAILDDSEHVCLSYMWGPREPRYTIYINDQPYSVGSSLHSFLKRARWLRIRDWLWIDAICIDQTNVSERNSQVQMMAAIYRLARHVLVYAGEISCWDSWMFYSGEILVDYCVEGVAAFLDVTAAFLLICLWLARYLNPMAWLWWATVGSRKFMLLKGWSFVASIFDVLSRIFECFVFWDDHLLPTLRTALQGCETQIRQSFRPFQQDHWIRLSQQEYWSRMWMKQEVYLANRVFFIAGFFLLEASEAHSFLEQSQMGRLFRRRDDRLTEASLTDVIIEFSQSDCTVKHDRIYALLGFVHTPSDFRVGYEKPLCVVILDLLQYFVQAHQPSLMDEASSCNEAIRQIAKLLDIELLRLCLACFEKLESQNGNQCKVERLYTHDESVPLDRRRHELSFWVPKPSGASKRWTTFNRCSWCAQRFLVLRANEVARVGLLVFAYWKRWREDVLLLHVRDEKTLGGTGSSAWVDTPSDTFTRSARPFLIAPDDGSARIQDMELSRSLAADGNS